MLAHTKAHHIEPQIEVLVKKPHSNKLFYINAENLEKIERYLEKYSEPEEVKSVAWEDLAKDRIAKYKKSGLVLRGMRYREDMSQKDLAARSGVSQNEISKIENGKRTVGEKVAKRLAKALNFDYRLLTQP